MRISDWSSDVCSSDLCPISSRRGDGATDRTAILAGHGRGRRPALRSGPALAPGKPPCRGDDCDPAGAVPHNGAMPDTLPDWLAYIERQHPRSIAMGLERVRAVRSEEHTSELQSTMRIPYA